MTLIPSEINTELNNTKSSKAAIKNAIEAKGVTVGSSATLADYADLIGDIVPIVGTKNITINGTYNASDDSLEGYSSVTVSCDDSGLIPREISQGTLQPVAITSFTLPNNCTNIGNYGASFAFYNCTTNTSVNLLNLTDVSGVYGLYQAFYGNTALTNINLTGLTNISGTAALQYTFYGCNNANMSGLTFTNLASLSGSSALQYAFANSSIPTVSFPALTSISGAACMNYAFQNDIALTSATFPVLTSITGQNAFSGAFYGCSNLTTLSFPNLVSVTGGTPFNQVMYNTGITSFELPELTTVSTGGLQQLCYYAKNLTSLSLPKLQYAQGDSCLKEICRMQSSSTNYSKITSISIPNLEVVEGHNALEEAFRNCYQCTSISFPKLKTLIGRQAARYMFRDCSGLSTSYTFPLLEQLGGEPSYSVNHNQLSPYNGGEMCQAFYGSPITQVSFPSLQKIYHYSSTTASYAMFYGNTTITRLDFPALTTISLPPTLVGTTYETNNHYKYGPLHLFDGCTNLVEIHFGSANRSAIEATEGYATLWGAPNANCTVYFDL